MGLLIPMSSKKMKEMGIVQTKKGLFVQANPPNKISVTPKSDNNPPSKNGSVTKEKPRSAERPAEQRAERPVERVQKVVIVDRPARARINKEEVVRLEKRGIY